MGAAWGRPSQVLPWTQWAGSQAKDMPLHLQQRPRRLRNSKGSDWRRRRSLQADPLYPPDGRRQALVP